MWLILWPGGPLECKGGYGARLRTRQCTRVHCLGVQKCAKLEKRECFWSYIDKFWKGHDRQIKKNACKKVFVGSIFIPEKCMIRVLFVSPWMSLIPPLAIWVPPPPPGFMITLFIIWHFCNNKNLPGKLWGHYFKYVMSCDQAKWVRTHKNTQFKM